jgi:hypothetical protein
VLRSLTHCIWHFTGFADTEAHLAVIVAHDNHCPEAEAAPTLDYLSRSGDMDHTFVELIALFLMWPSPFPILLAWHQSSLELQSARARPIGQRLNAPVIRIPAAIEYDQLQALRDRPAGNQLANPSRLLSLIKAGQFTPQLRIQGRRGDQSITQIVIYDLSINMLEASKHIQTRAQSSAMNISPNALMAAQASYPTHHFRH